MWIRVRGRMYSDTNPNPNLKCGGGVFFKFHIFALVAGAFYKKSEIFAMIEAVLFNSCSVMSI